MRASRCLEASLLANKKVAWMLSTKPGLKTRHLRMIVAASNEHGKLEIAQSQAHDLRGAEALA